MNKLFKLLKPIFLLLIFTVISIMMTSCGGGGGGGDGDPSSSDAEKRKNSNFGEQWENLSLKAYRPSDLVFLEGDEGYWFIGDTVSEDPECGTTPHTAEIINHNGSKALRLTSNNSGSYCADNLWVALFDTSKVGPLEYNKDFSIPITNPGYIYFEEEGLLSKYGQSSYNTNESTEPLAWKCFFPPCYDNISLLLEDNNGNILAYVMQHAPYANPDRSQSKYREIFLNPDAKIHARNLFKDFSTIPSFNPTNAQIVSVEFKIDEHGWAIFDNLLIGSNDSICSGANEICDDGIDNDCDGDIDCSDADCTDDSACESCSDSDSDGYFAETGCGTQIDCNDNDGEVHPGAVEVCDDVIDNDCDGALDCQDSDCIVNPACATCTDIDNDGHYIEAGCGSSIDCNDTDEDIHPNAIEICDDGIDNNCNMLADCLDASCSSEPICTGCTDSDNDDYYVEVGCGTEIDCNDSDQDIHPDTDEICNDEIDQDCDNKIDCADPDCSEDQSCTTCSDVDDDGYYAEAGCGTEIDCDDSTKTVHPGAIEVCDDGIENNCNDAKDLIDGKCTVAYYPFNGNANDESGNEHHGIVTGAILSSDRFGKNNKAYNFDGNDDVIDVSDQPAFHFTGKMTVAAWVKPTDLSGLNTIVSKNYAPDTFRLEIAHGNYSFITNFPGEIWWGEPVEITSEASIGSWTHVAGIYNGNYMYLYVNGELKASQVVSGTLHDSDRPISIGNFPEWSAYNGSIDDIRLYDDALSAEDILNLYNLNY